MKKEALSIQQWSLITKFNPVMEDVDITLLEKHPESIGDDNHGKENLKSSIEELGQGRPIICWRLPNGRLQIIDGSRIWLAITELKWQQATVLILEIEEENVFPMMCTLNSHNKKFRYKVLAEKFASLKKHAQSLIAEGALTDEDGNCPTTRKYLQAILGFTNERMVSDLERILKSPRKEHILDLLDGGQVSFARAVKMATKLVAPKCNTPIADGKGGTVYCCANCPEKNKFLGKANDESDVYPTINDLPTLND